MVVPKSFVFLIRRSTSFLYSCDCSSEVFNLVSISSRIESSSEYFSFTSASSFFISEFVRSWIACSLLRSRTNSLRRLLLAALSLLQILCKLSIVIGFFASVLIGDFTLVLRLVLLVGSSSPSEESVV